MIRLDHRELKRYEIAIFERLGVPPDQAEIVADNLVEADLRGVRFPWGSPGGAVCGSAEVGTPAAGNRGDGNSR